jgi:hypothetical protein
MMDQPWNCLVSGPRVDRLSWKPLAEEAEFGLTQGSVCRIDLSHSWQPYDRNNRDRKLVETDGEPIEVFNFACQYFRITDTYS